VAKAWLDGDVIVVDVEYHEKTLVQSVPAAKWSLARKRWEIPAEWGNALALRGSFGARLEVGDDLNVWAWRAREWAEYVEEAKTDYSQGQYGYQTGGTKFLHAAGSALLADEMGLGKSKQVIDAVVKLNAFPCLIVCPNSVKATWRDEWAKWGSTARVVVLSGSAKAKEKALSSLQGTADVVITNWESLRGMSRLAAYGSVALTSAQKKPGPLNRDWGSVVADEAHRGKDPKSQQTRALWAVAATARHRFALTGTPVANSPEDLWAVMHYVSPDEWPSKTKFIDRYCLASYNFWGGMDIDALRPDTRDELLAILDTRFLRRTKAEVLPFLPPITRQTRYVDLEPKQAKAYKEMCDEMIASLDSGILFTTSPMVRMMRLLQVASAYPVLDEEGQVAALDKPSCKVTALQDILQESPREQFVVFTVSRKLADLVHAECGGTLVTGEVSTEDRAEAVRGFQAGEHRLITLTTGAGAEGLTLTAASKAIFLQRPWSMVQSLQAEARIHRIGQDASSVEIIDIVAAGTVEEHVARTLEGKEELLQEVVRDKSRLVRFLKDGSLD
jgi:SWI/SNF-related matrix-associated actin-dependent regulator 1 of chromatin subfamily A